MITNATTPTIDQIITGRKLSLSIGSSGYKLSFERYFRPSTTYCTNPKNIPIAASEKPAWKFISPWKRFKPKPLAAQGTAQGATAAPKLIPKTNILKPESRRRSSGLYKPPTISETFGFNNPVPITIKAIDT